MLVGLVFAVLPAGSALAATTVGQTGTPSSSNSYSGSQELVMASDVMPSSGIVTSLNTQSSACGLATGTYNLQVLRPEGTDSHGNPQYLVLGDTGDQTDPCDSALHSYSVHIPVQAGDVIGAYVVARWQAVLTIGAGTDNFSLTTEPAVGDTISTPNTFSDTVDESATLLTTANLADQLVSDSTGVGTKGLLNKARQLQRDVTRGFDACRGISVYLRQVAHQAAQGLITGPQATTLTTDADNLSAGLGC